MDGPSKVVLESNRVGPRVTCSSPLEENYFLLDRSDLIINQAWPNFSQALHWLLSEEQKPKSKLWVWKFFWTWMWLKALYFHLLSERRRNLQNHVCRTRVTRPHKYSAIFRPSIVLVRIFTDNDVPSIVSRGFVRFRCGEVSVLTRTDGHNLLTPPSHENVMSYL